MSGRDVDPALDEDRLHRLGIAHLTEPGDPRVSGLVDDLGAAVVHEGLLRGLDLQGSILLSTFVLVSGGISIHDPFRVAMNGSLKRMPVSLYKRNTRL